MSSTTVSYRATTRSVSAEATRNAQAAAREAARREAARITREKNQRAEAARRQLQAAEHTIAKQDARLNQLVKRADAAAANLPDFVSPVVSFPDLVPEHRADPGKMEAYAKEITGIVDGFERNLANAIADADMKLKRQRRTAAAWRDALGLEEAFHVHRAGLGVLEQSLGQGGGFTAPHRPAEDAAPEAIEAYAAAFRQLIAAMQAREATLRNQLAVRRKAGELAGTTVIGRDAAAALASHAATTEGQARAALETHLATCLAQHGLSADALPTGTRELIDIALRDAHCGDQRWRIDRWLSRERRLRDDVARAEEMLHDIPPMLDDQALADRWAAHVASVRRVTAGFEPLAPRLETEHRQLHADARKYVECAYARAEWARTMSEKGFDIHDRDDGKPGFVLIDLTRPDVFINVEEQPTAEAGHIAVLTLMREGSETADDAAITADICDRLHKAATSVDSTVEAATEVLEHKTRITRGRRPRRATAAFAL